MYELSTTHRAAALTWMQRDLMLELHEREDAPEITLATHLNRTVMSIRQSLIFLLKRKFVDYWIDHDIPHSNSNGWDLHVYYLTDDGLAALKVLEQE
jgi:hypothetical protein